MSLKIAWMEFELIIPSKINEKVKTVLRLCQPMEIQIVEANSQTKSQER